MPNAKTRSAGSRSGPKSPPRVVKYSYLDRQFENREDLWADLRDLVKTGAFTIGPPVVEFERRLAEFVGVKHAIGTNTGTGALILALKGLGVGPGDDVITAPNSFYATAGSIVAVGARPVFVDVGEDMNIDVRLIEKAVTKKTRALLPVHWPGMPCDIDAILDIAKRRRLAVIFDACASLGATYRGRPAGSFGDAAAYSWHPLKSLNVWGDGGAIVTNNSKLAEWLKLYRNHGIVNRDEIELWGVNERLQSVQAVVALRMLDDIPGIVRRRQEIARRYDEAFLDLPGVVVPTRPAGAASAWMLYQIRVKRRAELMKFLSDGGVESKIHYPIPLHLQKPGRALGCKPGDFPVCEAQASDILTLPAHQHLDDDDVGYVVEVVRNFFARKRS